MDTSRTNPGWINVAEAAQMKSADRNEQFDRLMRDNGAAIVRVAAAFERNAAAREDLVQEIGLAIWRALPGFRGDCSERTLVLRIAQNRALTHLERRYRTRAAEEPDASDLRARGPDPEAAASSAQLRERLLEGIRSLSIGHRQLLTLLLEGLSHAEIADVLGITEGNVAVRALRARKALREQMGDLV